jgi:hypothetical protein
MNATEKIQALKEKLTMLPQKNAENAQEHERLRDEIRQRTRAVLLQSAEKVAAARALIAEAASASATLTGEEKTLGLPGMIELLRAEECALLAENYRTFHGDHREAAGEGDTIEQYHDQRVELCRENGELTGLVCITREGKPRSVFRILPVRKPTEEEAAWLESKGKSGYLFAGVWCPPDHPVVRWSREIEAAARYLKAKTGKMAGNLSIELGTAPDARLFSNLNLKHYAKGFFGTEHCNTPEQAEKDARFLHLTDQNPPESAFIQVKKSTSGDNAGNFITGPKYEY